MKNKNGFTLVELLAVVAIISILAMIAIPAVSEQINNSRKKVFLEDARAMVKASTVDFASGTYDLSNGIEEQKDKTIFSLAAINNILQKEVKKSPFKGGYSDGGVIVLNSKLSDGTPSYKYYVCLIDENGYGFDYVDSESLTVNNISVNQNLQNCTGLPKAKYNITVNVTNGTVETQTITVDANGTATFNLIPAEGYDETSVRCSNNQTANINNNVLTVSNVTASSTCTVTYSKVFTVLYSDGTLIINEDPNNRNTNKSLHGGSDPITYSGFSNSNNYVFKSATEQPWYNDSENIKKVEIGQSIKPTSTAYWFDGLMNMESVDLRKLDTSQVTNMAAMFRGKIERTYIGCGGNCETFAIDGKLKSLDLSNFNTSKVTNMNCMFEYQPALKTLDLTSFDTSKVTGMGYMFNYDNGLEMIDLSSFDTSKVTYMMNMFYMGLDSNSQDGVYNYFYNGERIPTSHLTTIYVSERWSVAGLDLSSPNSTNGMFCNAVSLPNYFKMPYTFRHDQYANYSDTGFLTYKPFNG